MKVLAPVREQDNHGAGYFGAPRGDRTHNGIDYACYPGSQVCARASGKVTKLGYPYGDDLNYRYVQITDDQDHDWRYFYVKPSVYEGDYVYQDSVIGVVQDLDKRYPGITSHCHLEIKKDGEYLDPGAL